MKHKKRSFFEKLTGAINVEEDDLLDEEVTVRTTAGDSNNALEEDNWPEESEQEAELTVDVYQTPDEIVLQTIVAGVNPTELDVTITRDMVTVAGRRERVQETMNDDYFHQELYWGAFSRTILLPEEIDVEGSQAVEKHGILTLHLPKIDKKKKTKLEVMSR